MNQKHISFDRHGDMLEIVIRNSSFVKIFKREVNINDRKGLEILLKDLRDKGVDLVGIIKRRMVDDSGWFEFDGASDSEIADWETEIWELIKAAQLEAYHA